MSQIYLDHNSTTPIDPSVAAVMAECYQAGYVNPASQHRLGQLARTRLETCRQSIADGLGATTRGMETDTLVFTSGGTESNNLAVAGLALAKIAEAKDDQYKRVILSAVEHPSVLGMTDYLKTLGFRVDLIEVDHNGVVRLDHLQMLIEQPAAVVSMMLANHETGVLQPVVAAAALCREQGIAFHTDAVQAVGKMSVDFAALGVDALSFTAHKFGGPRGVGGLVVRQGMTVQPQLFGGFQQMGTRPGTEDVALVAGMQQALQLYLDQPEQRRQHLAGLRDQMLASLRTAIPDLVVNGGDAEKTPQTLNVSFPGINRQAFLMAADMNGVAISTGSACASGSSEPSPVLIAMKAEPSAIEGAIRISVGASTTAEEIDRAAQDFGRIFGTLSGKK